MYESRRGKGRSEKNVRFFVLSPFSSLFRYLSSANDLTIRMGFIKSPTDTRTNAYPCCTVTKLFGEQTLCLFAPIFCSLSDLATQWWGNHARNWHSRLLTVQIIWYPFLGPHDNCKLLLKLQNTKRYNSTQISVRVTGDVHFKLHSFDYCPRVRPNWGLKTRVKRTNPFYLGR